jgi:hypothetical protein
MKISKQVPIDAIKEAMEYDPETGLFTWSIDIWTARKAIKKGDRAGFVSQLGYMIIGWKGKTYPAHRIAWAWIHGDSMNYIDHINGVRTDNRISNLRIASPSENCMNRKIPVHNTSGHKGVYLTGRQSKPWMARIMVEGRRIYIGHFHTSEEAGEAYKQAAIKYHGDFDYFTSQAKSSPQQIEPQIQSSYCFES